LYYWWEAFEEFLFLVVYSNGKSTLFDIVKASIGPYASEISPNFFCESQVQVPVLNLKFTNQDLVEVYFMAEPEENSTFNSSKSKCLLPSLLKRELY
jgi:hypothetical protein